MDHSVETSAETDRRTRAPAIAFFVAGVAFGAIGLASSNPVVGIAGLIAISTAITINCVDHGNHPPRTRAVLIGAGVVAFAVGFVSFPFGGVLGIASVVGFCVAIGIICVAAGPDPE